MTRYIFEALTADGHYHSSEIEAADRQAAFEDLSAQGLILLDLNELTTRAAKRKRSFSSFQFEKKSDVVLAIKMLSMLMNAGMTLERSFQSVIQQFAHKPIGQKLEAVLDRMREGEAFSDAIRHYPETFSKTFISLSKTGELTGRLTEVLHEFSQQVERLEKLKSKFKSAMIYPAILLVTIIITLTIILGFVVPQFEPMFERLDTVLPWSTTVILSASKLLQEHFILLALGGGISICLVVLAYRLRQLRLFFDRLLLAYSFGLMKKVEIARFSRIFGTMLSNGTDLATALTIALDAVQNLVLRNAILSVQEQVISGSLLSKAIQSQKDFPPLLGQLVDVGDQSGQLGSVLLKVAEIYDQEVETSLQRITTLMVPLITLVMGGLVAFLVIAILSGIMRVNALAI